MVGKNYSRRKREFLNEHGEEELEFFELFRKFFGLLESPTAEWKSNGTTPFSESSYPFEFLVYEILYGIPKTYMVLVPGEIYEQVQEDFQNEEPLPRHPEHHELCKKIDFMASELGDVWPICDDAGNLRTVTLNTYKKIHENKILLLAELTEKKQKEMDGHASEMLKFLLTKGKEKDQESAVIFEFLADKYEMALSGQAALTTAVCGLKWSGAPKEEIVEMVNALFLLCPDGPNEEVG